MFITIVFALYLYAAASEARRHKKNIEDLRQPTQQLFEQAVQAGRLRTEDVPPPVSFLKWLGIYLLVYAPVFGIAAVVSFYILQFLYI